MASVQKLIAIRKRYKGLSKVWQQFIGLLQKVNEKNREIPAPVVSKDGH